jgi:hypothetical protein
MNRRIVEAQSLDISMENGGWIISLFQYQNRTVDGVCFFHSLVEKLTLPETELFSVSWNPKQTCGGMQFFHAAMQQPRPSCVFDEYCLLACTKSIRSAIVKETTKPQRFSTLLLSIHLNH